MNSKRQKGLSLVELMVAMALGLLVMYGVLTLFNGVSRSNDLQAALARVQESGRFAVTTLEKDLRMVYSGYCASNGGYALAGRERRMWSEHRTLVEAPSLGAAGLPDSGGMRSVSATGNPSTSVATAAYGLSPRFMVQAYNCTTGTTCTPAMPSGAFPSAGLNVNLRVPNSDILTIRYLAGSGWDFSRPAANAQCVSGETLTLQPQAGDDPPNFVAGDLGWLASCYGATIFPISAIVGNNLQIGPKLTTGNICPPSENTARLYNFSKDFVTVSYYLAFRTNENPDARPNAGTRRLTPTLIRRVNGGAEEEVVRGVDQLAFRFGVIDDQGNLRMLQASQVANQMGGAIACPPKPLDVPPTPNSPAVREPGCLWRAISRIETHLLVNSENEARALDLASASFRFLGTEYAPAETEALPNQLLAGSMPRREFISQVSARNRNP